MLNGMLGKHLLNLSLDAKRFVDLFAGSGSVVHHVAQNSAIETVAVDQMLFPSILASAITGRTASLSSSAMVSSWLQPLVEEGGRPSLPVVPRDFDRSWVMGVRHDAAVFADDWFISRDYGGHYFSPVQAHWLDRAIQELPRDDEQRKVAMAAVIRVASDIAASPGHTAQPFQPSEVLLPHIRKAWSLDVLSRLRTEVEGLSSRHAIVKGEAHVGDAEVYAAEFLRDGDVVFLDPPYSEAQYGRFYHVLEGIARGGWGVVSGAGRAPAPAERVSSEFSRKSRAREAMLCLLKSLRSKQVTAVLTYPEGLRSNDLTWEFIAQEAAGLGFVTEISHVPMSHSTLGGSNSATAKRKARHSLREVVMTLRAE